MIPILILAAGQSTRMRGVDKLMEDIGGTTLLRRQIDCATGLGPVFVVLPSATHPRMQSVLGSDATAIFAPNAGEGMSATIRDAVAQIPACTAFMIVLADLISLENNDLRAVIAAMSEHPNHLIWRGATDDGKAGHPIIFDATLRPMFADIAGDTGADMIAKRLREQTYLHRFHDNRARHDLDTPEDFAAWRMSLGK